MSWPQRWHARWIWHEQPPAQGGLVATDLIPPRETWNRFCLLRTSCELPAVPHRVPARVTADSRFVLYVNGVEAARGPARSLPERLPWVELDLAPLLRPGRNAIAALVRFYGRPIAWWRPTPASGQLGYGGFAFEAPSIGVVSDGSWRALSAPYAPDTGSDPFYPAREEIDGVALPDGWALPEFDPSTWPLAVVLRAGAAERDRDAIPCAPYTLPEPEGVAPRTAIPLELLPLGSVSAPAAACDDPIRAFEASDGGAVDAPLWDVGGVTLATPWVAVAGPAGAIVDLYVGEDRRDDGRVEIRPRNWSLRYRLRGSAEDAPERIEAVDPVGFRYLMAVPRGDARIIAAGTTERRYPREQGALFECDDERLNAIWRAGLRTLEVCSSDAFIDCPGREQRAWLGDAYIHTLVSLVTNPDTRLVRRNLYVAAQSQRADGLLAMAAAGDLSLGATTVPDYSLHWIRALARYVEWTGDETAARELLPVAHDIIGFFERYRGDDGLLRDVPGWVFIDWATIARASCMAALDGLYRAALLDAQRIARAARDVLASERYIEPALRRPVDFAGAYLDGVKNGVCDTAWRETGRLQVSQQSTAAAYLGGFITPAATLPLEYALDEARLVLTPTYGDAPGISAFDLQRADPARFSPFDAETDVVAAQPFFAHFVHQAVAVVGWQDRLPLLCLKWWPMVAEGQTTLGEFWTAKPGAASRAHAWSATPTYDLIRHTLGLAPPRSTGQPFTLSPSLGPLRRLGARVPLPTGGWLEADLRDREGTVVVPPGARLALPSAGDGNDLLSSELLAGPGTHRFRW